jgi:hypothetical protein
MLQAALGIFRNQGEDPDSPNFPRIADDVPTAMWSPVYPLANPKQQ